MTILTDLEPWTYPYRPSLERLEADEFVALSAAYRIEIIEIINKFGRREGEEPWEASPRNAPGPVYVGGAIESARCAPRGLFLFHSDMGHPCESWLILDPVPAIRAEAGDLLFYCENAIHGRNARRRGDDPWPTPWAVMSPDERLYIAFLTDEHIKALYFPADEQGGE